MTRFGPVCRVCSHLTGENRCAQVSDVAHEPFVSLKNKEHNDFYFF